MYSFPPRNGSTASKASRSPQERRADNSVPSWLFCGCREPGMRSETEGGTRLSWSRTSTPPTPTRPALSRDLRKHGVPSPPPSQNGCLQGNSKTHQMLEKDARKMNSCTLPMGMRISTVTWKLTWIFLKKRKLIPPYDPAGPLLRAQWNLSHPPKYLCIHAYCCTIHTNQVMTVAQVLADGWMDRKYIAYVYNRTLFSHKEEINGIFRKRYVKIGELLVKKGAVRRWEEHIR